MVNSSSSINRENNQINDLISEFKISFIFFSTQSIFNYAELQSYAYTSFEAINN